MINNETCAACCFYRYGDCRRYPPQVFVYVGSETVGSDGDFREKVESHIESDWPAVEPSGWCGEFKSV
jgi:hypothetical protein